MWELGKRYEIGRWIFRKRLKTNYKLGHLHYKGWSWGDGYRKGFSEVSQSVHMNPTLHELHVCWGSDFTSSVTVQDVNFVFTVFLCIKHFFFPKDTSFSHTKVTTQFSKKKKKRQRSLQLTILVTWKLRVEECLCESVTGKVSYSVSCPLLHLAPTAWTFTLFQSWAKFHCQNTQTSFWKQNVNSSSHVLFPFLYGKVFHYKFNFFNR